MFLILICCNNYLVLLDHCSHGVIISQSQGRSPREGLHKVTCQLYSNPFVFICNSHKQINIHKVRQKYDWRFIIRVLFPAKQTILSSLSRAILGLLWGWSKWVISRLSSDTVYTQQKPMKARSPLTSNIYIPSFDTPSIPWPDNSL